MTDPTHTDATQTDPTLADPTREELLQLELELMQPGVRSDTARVEALLDEEFVEIGASGRLWAREEILALLAEEQEYEQPQVEDFRLRMLGPEIAQVAYGTISARGGVVLRSSIWRRSDQRWQCVFHQGTPEQGTPEQPTPAAAPQAGSPTA